MRKYIWENESWPELVWDSSELIQPLSRCRLLQGKLLGRLASADFGLGREAYAELLVEEAVQTSCIEGQILSRDSVRSSVARRLGLDTVGLPAPERHAEGIVDVLTDATENFDRPLTSERLKSWQAALFPTGYSGLCRIITGGWRGEAPMRIVSGPVGREKVHYEAPPYKRVETEMTQFMRWWSESRGNMDGILRAGLAHFRFVVIHPFEDGNGRIARALTDMAMAQDEGIRQRFYSLSSQIMAEREAYYTVLEKNSRVRDGDVTFWMSWFLECFAGAVKRSGQTLNRVFAKADFWKTHARTSMSNRQEKVVGRLLDAGRGGFEGGMTTRKYASLAKVSRATAQREISDLVEKKVLKPNPGGGRSTSYELVWPDPPEGYFLL